MKPRLKLILAASCSERYVLAWRIFEQVRSHFSSFSWAKYSLLQFILRGKAERACQNFSNMLNTKQKIRIAGALTTLLLAAFGAGCGWFVSPTLTSLSVGPTATIQQNGTVQESAVGNYSDGSSSTLSSVFWSSSDTSVATVNNSGLVTGVSPGSSTITAASGTVSGTSTITVALSNVTGITVSPTTANATVNGGTANFTASATVSGGSPTDITATATWSISSVKGGTGTPTTSDFAVVQGQNPEVVTVESTATVGEQATVTASYTSGANTFTASATLTVTPAP